MKYVQFTDSEKIECFDTIASEFYHSNFGQISKSDMELMMFNFYIQKMIKDNKDEDGVIDYSKCSDYRISQDLGITQQRVRNLKIKNHLVHPIDFSWKRSLAKLTENARYDSITKKVTLNIPDPNLYLDIQNYIEENGAYIEKQLNSKILQLRAEYYIDLILTLEDDSSRKKIIKQLKKFFKDNNKDASLFDEKEIGKSLIEATVNITSIVANISGMISPGNVIGNALMKLLKT